jgi:hypothetical protein
MRMPHQALGVNRGPWTGASIDKVDAANAAVIARMIGGGGYGSVGGTLCRYGCGAAYVACCGACAETGPFAAQCLAGCTVLYDFCKEGCPSFGGGGSGVLID